VNLSKIVFTSLIACAMLVTDLRADEIAFDEASRPCPPQLDVTNRAQAWWCGFDAQSVVDDVSNPKRLNVFKEHTYANISPIATDKINEIDWTCIDGECGGLLDGSFIRNRELTHLWKASSSDHKLIMREEQRQRAIRGRNSWLLWTGGNHGFWDHLARHGLGLADFLKLLDNRYINRADRFRKLGVINEPGMTSPSSPDRFGLQLDIPEGWLGDWPPAPGTALPKEVPDPYVYGYSSGVMGFRIFPNPQFFYGTEAKEAQAQWDSNKYFTDVNYSKDPDLVRPYRVGMSCGLCHVSFNPLVPPANPAEPEWKNISSTAGAGYLKFSRVSAFDFTPENFLWHLLHSAEPGTIDTSLVATDGINNPNVANGIFGLLPRLTNSLRIKETAGPQASEMPVLDLSVLGLGLPDLPEGSNRTTMRVLAGGEDSVGGRLALARVYLNLGSYFEHWNVSLMRSQNMAEFLTYASGPTRLKDADGGSVYQTDEQLTSADRGVSHFVSHCMVCHSSKQPKRLWGDPANWQKWVQDQEYLDEALLLANDPDFRIGNYLSTDMRYPVSDIGINTSRFLSDNANEHRVWSEFSSAEFKSQPVLETAIKGTHPYDQDVSIQLKIDDRVGPARTRPLSLMNIWASAPFLHNNSVGQYPNDADPGNYLAEHAADVSVGGRMSVFQDSIETLLHLRPRLGQSSIARTTVDSAFRLERVVLADLIERQLGKGWLFGIILFLVFVFLLGLWLVLRSLWRLRFPGVGRVVASISLLIGFFFMISSINLIYKDTYKFGHIPAGTPVNLIANLNGPGWLGDNAELSDYITIGVGLGKVWLFNLASLDDPSVPKLVPTLLKLNKSPDFVRDRGHDFGGRNITDDNGNVILQALSEVQRRELIEYLKTL